MPPKRTPLPVELQRFCGEAGYPTVDGVLQLELGDGREHRVKVVEVDADTLRVDAVVCHASALSGLDDVALRVWRRNRGTRLVSFRIAQGGAVTGHAWVPRFALAADELALYIKTVATECDRFEFLLTGQDLE